MLIQPFFISPFGRYCGLSCVLNDFDIDSGMYMMAPSESIAAELIVPPKNAIGTMFPMLRKIG